MNNLNNYRFAPHKSSLGMDANVLAMLIYVLTGVLSFLIGGTVAYFIFIAPLVILFIEKESDLVRFHAAQCTLLNLFNMAVVFIIGLIADMMFTASISSFSLSGLGGSAMFIAGITLIFGIFVLIVSILQCFKAYAFQINFIPLLGPLAVKLMDKAKEIQKNNNQGGTPPQGGGYNQGGYNQGGTPPQGGYTPPAQGGFAPPQGGAAPQGGYTPPAQGGFAPPQGGAAPQGGYTPPAAPAQGGFTPPAAPQGGFTPPAAPAQGGFTSPAAPQGGFTPPAAPAQGGFTPPAAPAQGGFTPPAAPQGGFTPPAAPAAPTEPAQGGYNPNMGAYAPPAAPVEENKIPPAPAPSSSNIDDIL